jgi:hypothetical protein
MLVAGGWGASSCAPSGFAEVSSIQDGVRILASSADKPYASPGDTVTVSVLAYDGRNQTQHCANPEPMRVTWWPLVCQDPPNDAYYACFAGFANNAGGTPGQQLNDAGGGAGADSGADAGADASTDAPASVTADATVDGGAGTPDAGGDAFAAANLEGGPDAACADAGLLDPVVSSFRFTVPRDAVSAHAPTPGIPPFGLMIAFNVACAGDLVPIMGDLGTNPQAPPFKCVGSDGGTLGPESYVFGFTRVYVHEPTSGVPQNNNPVIDSIDIECPLGNDGGATGSFCMSGMIPLLNGPAYDAPTLNVPCTRGLPTCPRVKMGPVVPPDSWEPVDPCPPGASCLREQIWVDFYSTLGRFTHNARLLYDAKQGAVGAATDTDTEFEPPAAPSNDAGSEVDDGFLWMVVHDNRGGASWVTVPVHVNR